MSSEHVILLDGLSKEYRIFERPADRLLAMLPGLRRYARQQSFHGLRPLDLTIQRGEVVGLLGRNGAGKSTLLQLICGTLPATAGKRIVNGRISALLELGAGFNPEFTGRENVHLSASILGLSRQDLQQQMGDILDFADIGDFIDQPVKTYSSGMYVRLAFAVATAVRPDILVVDEALSVGDGAFARKSFNRIMAMKESGTTILFCSHSLYQVEAICSRALWIERGALIEDGPPGDVIAHYQRFLDSGRLPTPSSFSASSAAGSDANGTITEAHRREASCHAPPPPQPSPPPVVAPELSQSVGPKGHARLTRVRVSVDGQAGDSLEARSELSCLDIEVSFDSDPELPCPTVAVTLSDASGTIITSAATWEDGIQIKRDASGRGQAHITYPALPLLKGHYRVGGYVFCERGIHSYGWIDPAAFVTVTQKGMEKGVCLLPHHWSTSG